MYCLKCGQKIQEDETSCASCGAAVPPPSLIKKENKLVHFFTSPLPFSLLFLILSGTLAFGILSLYRSVVMPDPKATVGNFYDAIQNHDKEKALNLVQPDKRDQGLGFNLELLMQPSVKIEYDNLKFKVVEKTKTSARVRVSGTAKVIIEGKTREINFNDEAVLQAEQKQWYLDSSSLGDLFVL